MGYNHRGTSPYWEAWLGLPKRVIEGTPTLANDIETAAWIFTCSLHADHEIEPKGLIENGFFTHSYRRWRACRRSFGCNCVPPQKEHFRLGLLSRANDDLGSQDNGTDHRQQHWVSARELRPDAWPARPTEP